MGRMNVIKTRALVVGDLFAAILSFILMLVIGFGSSPDSLPVSEHVFPFILVYAVWFVVLYLFNFYDHISMRPTLSRLRSVGIVVLLWLVLGAFIFYALPWFRVTPKTNLILAVLLFVSLLVLWRRLYFAYFSTKLYEQVAIVGSREGLSDLVDLLMSDSYLGYRYRGTYESIQEIPKGINTIVWNKERFNEGDIHFLHTRSIRFMQVSDMYEEAFQRIPVHLINEGWFVERVRTVRQRAYEFVARVVDVVLAAFVLIITAPLWVIIGCAIYFEDRGPILFYHKRVGENKKTFLLRKFRSMHVNAEKQKALWAEKNDPRVTRVGKWLRKLHIDELPQMINVLIGDMTLVGPRPEHPDFVDKLEQAVPHYSLRHIIKPGFTGWAQIKYRYARSVEESQTKFEYDLYYIKNRNIFLDCGIILKTIQIIFTH